MYHLRMDYSKMFYIIYFEFQAQSYNPRTDVKHLSTLVEFWEWDVTIPAQCSTSHIFKRVKFIHAWGKLKGNSHEKIHTGDASKQ